MSFGDNFRRSPVLAEVSGPLPTNSSALIRPAARNKFHLDKNHGRIAKASSSEEEDDEVSEEDDEQQQEISSSRTERSHPSGITNPTTIPAASRQKDSRKDVRKDVRKDLGKDLDNDHRKDHRKYLRRDNRRNFHNNNQRVLLKEGLSSSSDMDTSASEDLLEELENPNQNEKPKTLDSKKDNKMEKSQGIIINPRRHGNIHNQNDQDDHDNPDHMSEDDDEEDEEEDQELLLPNNHKNVNIGDDEREQVRRFLFRPSAVELAKQQQQQQSESSNITTKKPSLNKEPSFNMKLLQSEISRVQLPSSSSSLVPSPDVTNKKEPSPLKIVTEDKDGEKKNKSLPITNNSPIVVTAAPDPTSKSYGTCGIIAPADNVPQQPIPNPTNNNTFLHHYRYQTVTDNGSKWGREYRNQQPILSRFYCISSYLNPDGDVPSLHSPIVLTASSFAQMEVKLSWFPIRNQTESGSVVPLNAVRGSTTIYVQCFPHLFRTAQAHFTGDLDCMIQHKKINPSSKTCAICIQDQVIVSMRIFSNQKKVLNIIKKDPKQSPTSLFYLDFHVAHMRQDTNQYRLFWLADISVNTIKWIQ